MAKCRFPGKALRLNARKRIKFNWDSEKNPDEARVLQIKSGLLLFKHIFGESEEEDEFDGFLSGVSPQNNGKSNSNQRKIDDQFCLDQKGKSKHFSKLSKGEKEEKEKSEINENPKLIFLSSSPAEDTSCYLSASKKDSSESINIQEHLQLEELSERMAIKRRKFLMKDNERSSKKFVLPTVSAHSSRVIKPNMRLFTDMAPHCSTSSMPVAKVQDDIDTDLGKQGFPMKLLNQNRLSVSPDFTEEKEKDPVCRSITLYTDAITEKCKGQVGRPPKRLIRRNENQVKDEIIYTNNDISPVKGAKEEKVKEKIEKLLRSPWDERLKQTISSNSSTKEADVSVPVMSASKTIIRKARLNLNKKTLQKIRSPASLQHLVPSLENDSFNRKCGLCQNTSSKTVVCYGVACCETCHLTMNCFIEGTFSSLVCYGGQGECQLVGLSPQERCEACWLSKILASCAMPNILHDNLRKRLPSIIREKVPSSLGRSFNVNSIALPPRDITVSDSKQFSMDDSSYGGFGSVIDLPGGWKRKCGKKLTVISPSGAKFRTISKLDKYLKRQGINADAGVLFGSNLNLKEQGNSVESKHNNKLKNKNNNVVLTTLPGGWSRRIKWRLSGDKFDTYVCSPDGRTFRSPKDLGAYFQKIGKIDDMNKYFPVKSSSLSYSENSEASTMEPLSDVSSEISSEKSTAESDSEKEMISEILLDNSVTDDKVSCNIKITSPSPNENKEDATVEHEGIDENTNSRVIISNFTSNFLTNASKLFLDQQEDSGLASNFHLNLDNDIKSVSSISESFDEYSSAIDLNLLSDSKFDDELSYHSKAKIKDKDSDRFVLKIPKNFNDSSVLDIHKDHSRHKHKKHKKKKKKHRSSKNYETDHDDVKCPRNKKSESDQSSGKHHHSSKRCESDDNLMLHLSKNSESKNVINHENVDDIESTASEYERINVKFSSGPTTFIESSLTSEPSNSINISTILSDPSLQSTPVFHPNDTWQTLINNSTNEASLTVSSANSKVNEIGINCIESCDKIVNILDTQKKGPKIKKILPKSSFTKEYFGNGWLRKIKWNSDGQGKVAFLMSPDGQRIVSSIELFAYFKKAGKPLPALEYYFPQNIVKNDIESSNLKVNELELNQLGTENSLVGKKDLDTNLSKSQIVSRRRLGKLGRGRGRKVLYKLPKSKFGTRALKHLESASAIQEASNLESDYENDRLVDNNLEGQTDNSVHLDGGPRVKHVCRSQAQVLGMPRAVFPSPDKEKPIIKKVLYADKKIKKYLAVVTPKGRKVLRKTVWCHKCAGCTTPNCKKCSNCLDMKKYGGPGTKKKPCIMRKCHNPIKAVKASISKENLSSIDGENSEMERGDKNSNSKREDFDVISIKLSSLQNSESDVDLVDVNCKDGRYQEVNLTNSSEKHIFVPKLQNRYNCEVKDRVDILEGKELVPGARVNIDYWQDYDAEEMLMNGFPIITSIPLEVGFLCFRCGSGGLEEMLFCIWCCEGVHPFCLEEGEGPESDEQENLWVCKKCTVCHVCGAPNDLMQCNDCRRHFHIECLGPMSHISCHTASDGSWNMEAMKLLSLSLPQQTPLIDVGDCDQPYSTLMDEFCISLYEEMDRFEDEFSKRPRTYLLPTAKTFQSSWQHSETFSSPDKNKKKEVLIESVFIEDTPENLEEEGGFCLEDEFDGFDCILPINEPPKMEDMLSLFTNVNLQPDHIIHEQQKNLRNRIGLNVEEYLGLGYSKVTPFHQYPSDFSWYRLLQMMHDELFTVLKYPTWSELFSKGLVHEHSWKHDPSDCWSVSDITECTSPIDVKSILAIRRAEVQLDIKERWEKRIMEERRVRELIREKSRQKKLLEKQKVMKTENNKETNEEASEEFLNYGNLDEAEEGCESLWQPQSWQEFDSLFAQTGASTSNFENIQDVNLEINEIKIAEEALEVPCKIIEPKSEELLCDANSPEIHVNLIKRKKLSMSPRRKRLKLLKCSVKMPKIDLKNMKNSFNLETSKDKTMPTLKLTEDDKDKLLKKRKNSLFEENNEMLNFSMEDDSQSDCDIVLESNQNCEISNDNYCKILDICAASTEINSPVSTPPASNLDSSTNNSLHTSELVNNCGETKSKTLKTGNQISEASATGNQESRRSSRVPHGRASELASLRKALLDV